MRNMYQLSSLQYLPRIIVCVFIAKQMVSLASFSKQQLIWDYLVYLLQIQLSEVNMNCLGENNIYKNRSFLLIGTTSSSQKDSFSPCLIVSAWCLVSVVGIVVVLLHICVAHHSLIKHFHIVSFGFSTKGSMWLRRVLTAALSSWQRTCTFRSRKLKVLGRFQTVLELQKKCLRKFGEVCGAVDVLM